MLTYLFQIFYQAFIATNFINLQLTLDGVKFIALTPQRANVSGLKKLINAWTLCLWQISAAPKILRNHTVPRITFNTKLVIAIPHFWADSVLQLACGDMVIKHIFTLTMNKPLIPVARII